MTNKSTIEFIEVNTISEDISNHDCVLVFSEDLGEYIVIHNFSGVWKYYDGGGYSTFSLTNITKYAVLI